MLEVGVEGVAEEFEDTATLLAAGRLPRPDDTVEVLGRLQVCLWIATVVGVPFGHTKTQVLRKRQRADLLPGRLEATGVDMYAVDMKPLSLGCLPQSPAKAWRWLHFELP